MGKIMKTISVFLVIVFSITSVNAKNNNKKNWNSFHNFNHFDMGIYLTALDDGEVNIGNIISF